MRRRERHRKKGKGLVFAVGWMDAAEERRKEDAGIDARPIYGLYGVLLKYTKKNCRGQTHECRRGLRASQDIHAFVLWIAGKRLTLFGRYDNLFN